MNIKKEVTIYDIARELALSPSTISRALNRTSLVHEETRARIQQKAKDLGYRQNFFASSLRSQQTHVIAAMVSQLSTSMASNVVSGAETMARQAGYNLVVSQWMNDPDLYAAVIENLNKSRVDGLLVTAANAHQHPLVTVDTKPGMPRVVIEACAPLRQYNSSRGVVQTALPVSSKEITDHNFNTGYNLTALLLKRGSRRIKFIAANENIIHKNILSGYRQALHDHGITGESALTGFDTARSGMDVCRRLMSAPSRPDGVIFLNGILTALSIADINADHVVDNNSTLTTMDNDLAADNSPFLEVGNIATALLISLIENKHH